MFFVGGSSDFFLRLLRGLLGLTLLLLVLFDDDDDHDDDDDISDVVVVAVSLNLLLVRVALP